MVRTTTQRAPGKLYIAGEYAVVTPLHTVIGLAVDRFLTVTIAPSEEGTFFSKNHTDDELSWGRNIQGEFNLNSDDFQLVNDIVRTVERYVVEHDEVLTTYSIDIESELDGSNGRKYGLGSSGALTVALTKGLLDFYDLPFDDSDVFKLSALSHMENGNNGSFGDLAISTYGGVIAYTNFERSGFDFDQSISKLMANEWEGLEINRITLPSDINFIVGWTGKPVSTGIQVEKAYGDGGLSESDFLTKSQDVVKAILEACKLSDSALFLSNIEKNRYLLQELAEMRQLAIETPALNNFIQTIEEYEGKAKTSGSGGGDCGIGFFNTDFDVKQLEKSLQQQAIIRLDLAIASRKDNL